MSDSHKPLRWGIIGSGKICWDFCVALSTLPKDEHTIEHISAREASRAKDFASHFGVEKYTDKYIEVAHDMKVDVCYIGTINTTHRDLSIMAMNCGKHVLCEKPVAMNSKELNNILECAKQNNVFFMEAVWTRCFPLYLDIQSKLKSGYYGEPNVLIGTFGIGGIFDNVPRIYDSKLGGGVLLDIGIYLLTVADMIFEGYSVKDIKICPHIHDNGLDRSASITILYENKKIAHLLYSGDNDLPNKIELLCSKGNVTISKPFHCSESYSELINNEKMQTFDFSLPTPSKKMFFVNSMGLKYEAEHVRECLLAGKVESSIISHETSKRITSMMDQLIEQMKKFV